MATGRTISASFLTDLDTKIIEFCNSISELILNSIEDKKDFFLCFPTKGASLGWMVNVYREVDGRLLHDMTVDTGQ